MPVTTRVSNGTANQYLERTQDCVCLFFCWAFLNTLLWYLEVQRPEVKGQTLLGRARWLHLSLFPLPFPKNTEFPSFLEENIRQFGIFWLACSYLNYLSMSFQWNGILWPQTMQDCTRFFFWITGFLKLVSPCVGMDLRRGWSKCMLFFGSWQRKEHPIDWPPSDCSPDGS